MVEFSKIVSYHNYVTDTGKYLWGKLLCIVHSARLAPPTLSLKINTLAQCGLLRFQSVVHEGGSPTWASQPLIPSRIFAELLSNVFGQV